MSEPTPAAEAMSLSDVSAHYPWEWVLLKVTDTDAQGVITHGVVLDHSPRRRAINKMIKRLR